VTKDAYGNLVGGEKQAATEAITGALFGAIEGRPSERAPRDA